MATCQMHCFSNIHNHARQVLYGTAIIKLKAQEMIAHPGSNNGSPKEKHINTCS
ncbi:hypothetical protein PVAP13_7KG214400 [Panicum virgatum]|uniref:Uncharacterized protein n=1 Tax=Panicum virgatum TaxID=38727 RepID=A0A8T0QFX9_PANVG|nr:hypothetical protein PVAP13_7KG214400 [Panicum virgatum]